ncbi:MAG: Rieske (2Fe-2S) protein [Pseudomonadales bacterium]
MPEQQILTPYPGSAIPHVGSYRRLLPVSLERMYENALDWEHLPYVHEGSFAAIDCEASGPWGWRAAVVTPRGQRSVIELRLDRSCHRWITRNLSGPNLGAEIWTHVFQLAPQRLEIVVDFFVPGVAEEQRSRVGAAYAALYARLYDEDVAMMVERQRQLDRRIDRARDDERVLQLGPRDQLDLPRAVVLGGRDFVVAESAGMLVVFPAQCPHQLGPLSATGLDDGVLTCPWHGYRFDVRTGANLSGQACSLSHLPEIEIATDGSVLLRARH